MAASPHRPVTTWTAAQVAAALGVPAPTRQSFCGVSTDTRGLRGGELFVALRGERFDAHDFLAEAKAKGAAAAVVRQGTAPVDGLPFFAVADTLPALGRLARARRRLLPPAAPVVAITGSSGKTSTKELIRAVLATRYRVHATSGNLNNLVGVPLTILGAPDDAEALVVEAGASVPGEIAQLRDIIEPTLAVVTNVGYAHVEGFGSLAGVLREKLALVDGARLAIVGTEPPELAQQARRITWTVVAGTGDIADPEYRAEATGLADNGRAWLRWSGQEVLLALAGVHQAENAMLALAVADAAGVPRDAAMAALTAVEVPGRRGRVVRRGGLVIIDDTYNANPGSLRRALDLARRLADREGRPLAVVVGSMLELGPESGRLHAAAAREIAELGPALVAAVGEFVPVFEPLRGTLGGRLVTAPDAAALGPRLKAALRGDEVVLLKASRSVALERVLEHLD